LDEKNGGPLSVLHVSKRGIFRFGFQNLGETLLGVLLGQSQQRRPHLIFVTRCATKQKRVSLLRKWGHWAFLLTRSTPFWSSMVMMESWKYESTPKRRNGAGAGPAPFVKRNGAGPAPAPMCSAFSLVESNQMYIDVLYIGLGRNVCWKDLDQF